MPNKFNTAFNISEAKSVAGITVGATFSTGEVDGEAASRDTVKVFAAELTETFVP